MFNIPKITKYLLIINVVVFLLTQLVGMPGMGGSAAMAVNNLFGLHFVLAPNFHFYQLFTYMFLHGGVAHLFFNMFALWMFGCVVENMWGPRKFLTYYLVCGMGAGLFQELAQLVEFMLMCQNQIPGFALTDALTVAANSASVLSLWTTVGASGAVYGILLAFGMLFPEQRIFVFPLPFPIKAKWFVCGYAAVELFSAMSTNSDGIAHIAHLGGMVFGYFLIRYWNKRPQNYFGGSAQNMFNGMRSRFTSATGNVFGTGGAGGTGGKNSVWEQNGKRAELQKEIDAILDKIRRSGYDSLTKEEKQKLFDGSRNF